MDARKKFSATLNYLYMQLGRLIDVEVCGGQDPAGISREQRLGRMGATLAELEDARAELSEKRYDVLFASAHNAVEHAKRLLVSWDDTRADFVQSGNAELLELLDSYRDFIAIAARFVCDMEQWADTFPESLQDEEDE